jgi:hypothetical protein
VLRTLTDEERTARARALGDARLREAEERKIAEEEALLRKSRETVERSERDAAEARKAEEERRRKHELETKLKAEQEAKKRPVRKQRTPSPWLDGLRSNLMRKRRRGRDAARAPGERPPPRNLRAQHRSGRTADA